MFLVFKKTPTHTKRKRNQTAILWNHINIKKPYACILTSTKSVILNALLYKS